MELILHQSHGSLMQGLLQVCSRLFRDLGGEQPPLKRLTWNEMDEFQHKGCVMPCSAAYTQTTLIASCMFDFRRAISCEQRHALAGTSSWTTSWEGMLRPGSAARLSPSSVKVPAVISASHWHDYEATIQQSMQLGKEKQE